MKLANVLLVFLLVSAHAATINVPADQPTIQAAINAASNGDIVVVAPGTYFENINFMGKAITVRSASGPKVTIIDGGNVGTVVTFNSGETTKSVLGGFTIQHGQASAIDGGGIYVSYASPEIRGNVITDNVACGNGAGIALESSQAYVVENVIENNAEAGCTGGAGGGLYAGGLGPLVSGNLIQNNTSNFGGGVGVFSASPLLENNIIHSNVANASFSASQGGGIWMEDGISGIIVQNLVYNNTASQGSGIYLSASADTPGAQFLNNTIVGNASSAQGSALYAFIAQPQVQFANNLLIGAKGTNAVYCDFYPGITAQIYSNDAYSPGGSGLGGECVSEVGQNGNLSANPMFVGPTNFRLQAGSPAINAGANSVPYILPTDLAGSPRIVDGIIDIGAYEYPN